MATTKSPAANIPSTLEHLRVPVSTLKHYARNPRRGDVAAIAESLEQHGQYRPLVVNRRTGEVLAGNHTLQAAVELGWDEVAATFVDVDDEQAARIVLVDNRLGDLAGYDDNELATLLRSLPDLDGTGWRPAELDRLLDELDVAGDAGRDTDPMPAPAKPTAKPGDVWQLGDHRLVCGDSTQPGPVERVLAGDEVEMVWTDPPYGVHYVGKTADAMTFENDRGGEALYELLHGSLTLACQAAKKGGAIYVAHGDGANGTVCRRAVADSGWELHQTLIWVKNTFALSRHDYHWQHEAILYGWKPGAAHRWQSSPTETTVIDDETNVGKLGRRELVALIRQLRNDRRTSIVREDKPHRNDLHPTMKPIGLVAHQVANSSRRGDIVYDPFGGSGSTLIACENLRRPARLVEIDPAYCDVIVDRWQRHTDQEAKRDARSR
jgi:site-specific DNA-methyltransferase (adenine-specific)